MKIIWAPRARRQLEHAIDYIARNNPEAAWRIRDRIVERASQIAAFDDIGPAGKLPGTRDLTITGTEYVLVYRVLDEVIEVAAVWHGKQSRKR
jgi:toxin ParE1/3/4